MVGVGRSAAFARAEDRGMARAGKGYDPVGNNFCVIDRAEAEARAYRDSDRLRHVCAVRGHCAWRDRRAAAECRQYHRREYGLKQHSHFVGTFKFSRNIEEGQARKSVVWGQSVSVRVDLGGRRIIKKKNNTTIS